MTDAELKNYLAGFDVFGANITEGQQYLAGAFQRLLTTLSMLPESPQTGGRLLELGASPFFLTILLKRVSSYSLTLANFFGDGHHSNGNGRQTVSNHACNESHTFYYDHFNIERDCFPYADQTFDVVIFGEILEHLTLNPLHPLYEIRRVLKPGGYLLLTTPNVLACQNVLKLAAGRNIYDRYSGYGIYGRHNREYTPGEVVKLLQRSGFDLTHLRIEDVYAHRRLFVRLMKSLRPQWRDGIFALARASATPAPGYPKWLYQSMPRCEQGDDRA